MTIRAARWVLGILIVVWVSLGAEAPPPREPLRPGLVFRIEFPDLPPTLAEMVDPKGIKPSMAVSLPRNYDPQRQHPLLVFLGGGAGSRGTWPGPARKITEEQDFVCVDLPLFKAKHTPGPGITAIILKPEDYRFAWPHYRTMLTALEQRVPNLDPARRVLGGPSNGAHMTAGLLDESNDEVSQRFAAFIFVEGGGRLQNYERLKGKSLLVAVGQNNERAVKRGGEIRDMAAKAGARAVLQVMAGIGHAFPETAYPAVRDWLRGPAFTKAEQP